MPSGFNGIDFNTIFDAIIHPLEEAAKLLMVLLSSWEQLVKNQPQQSIPSVLLTRESSPMAF
jgi:hypothetical protein